MRVCCVLRRTGFDAIDGATDNACPRAQSGHVLMTSEISATDPKEIFRGWRGETHSKIILGGINSVLTQKEFAFLGSLILRDQPFVE